MYWQVEFYTGGLVWKVVSDDGDDDDIGVAMAVEEVDDHVLPAVLVPDGDEGPELKMGFHGV